MIEPEKLAFADEICAIVTDELTERYERAKEQFDRARETYEKDIERAERAFAHAEKHFIFDLTELIDEWHHCSSCGEPAHLDGCFNCGISTTSEEKP
jgi:molecular chaperone GrpE (heat shock protein)